MKQLSQIISGWWKHFFPSPVILRLSEERLSFCNSCRYNSKWGEDTLQKKKWKWRWDEHCVICGCTLKAKTKCPSCECPDGKWTFVNIEEYEKGK